MLGWVYIPILIVLVVVLLLGAFIIRRMSQQKHVYKRVDNEPLSTYLRMVIAESTPRRRAWTQKNSGSNSPDEASLSGRPAANEAMPQEGAEQCRP